MDSWDETMKRAKGKFMFSAIILLRCLLLCVADLDAITKDKPIRDGQLLTSKEEKFALGFFTPGNKSNYRYVGIWYHNFPTQTVVWVANRDNPITDKSGVLSIDSNGNLVLHQNSSNLPIWSTNVSVSVFPNNKPIIAQLSDLGNLVLIQNDESKTLLWESFDHPTDTLLPYAKLGVNKITGQSWFLQSWKNEEDPGTGSFSVRFSTRGKSQVFLYKNNFPLWRAGPSNGEILVGIPSLKRAMPNILNVSVPDNDDEVGYMYNAISKTNIFRLVVLPSGLAQLFKWDDSLNEWTRQWSAPELNCDYYESCGSNSKCDPQNQSNFRCSCLPGYEPKNPTDWNQNNVVTEGCVRKKGSLSMCGNNGEGFVMVRKVKIPETSIANCKMGLNMEECEGACLRNCSCTAYAATDMRNGLGCGCLTWHGALMDTQVLSEGGQYLYVRVDAIELAKYARKAKGMLAMARMVGITAASITFIVLLVAIIVYWFQKNKREQQLKMDSEEEQAVNSAQLALSFFSIKIIMTATNKFSNENKLGEGGFGCVYKGLLVDGQEIAVKRLSKGHGQGIQEFKNEIKLIAKLQHRNLVKLLGYCIHKEERMLIYEHLPNKSLDFYLFDMNHRSRLDWNARFHIIFGIARGVLYLHQDSRLKIIHRDLKASNILLDVAMHPKILDFGMAKIFGEDQI